MLLLRLISDILIYVTLGLCVYYYFMADNTALFIAIGCGAIAIVILLTTSSKHTGSNRQSNGWDWWDIIDFIEIPYVIIRWLFKAVFKIFD